MSEFEIYLVCTPGLEHILANELAEKNFPAAVISPGGVSFIGNWNDVAWANFELRGAGAVFARLGTFRASHLSELDKRARKFPWLETFTKNHPVRVETSAKSSKIYHSGAIKSRIENALREEAGLTVHDEAAIEIKARIEKDICTISVNTSGVDLHKRGFKEAMAKAPMRETMAALFLRQSGFSGVETVLDPMCGSGTFLIEAAEWAAGLAPGRKRKFSFELLNPALVARPSSALQAPSPAGGRVKFYGYDRDAGAIKASTENAARAGVAANIIFNQQPISALQRPDCAPGLVMINPPYGARIGDKAKLTALYKSMGNVLRDRFSAWRVGIVTDDKSLAAATGLPFVPLDKPVLHGGLRVHLFRTFALP